MKKNCKIKIKNCTIIFNIKICAQIVKRYAQLFKNYIPYFLSPPLQYNRCGNIGEGRQNENLINIVNGEYRGIFDPPGNLPEKLFSTAYRLSFRIT